MGLDWFAFEFALDLGCVLCFGCFVLCWWLFGLLGLGLLFVLCVWVGWVLLICRFGFGWVGFCDCGFVSHCLGWWFSVLVWV